MYSSYGGISADRITDSRTASSLSLRCCCLSRASAARLIGSRVSLSPLLPILYSACVCTCVLHSVCVTGSPALCVQGCLTDASVMRTQVLLRGWGACLPLQALCISWCDGKRARRRRRDRDSETGMTDALTSVFLRRETVAGAAIARSTHGHVKSRRRRRRSGNEIPTQTPFGTTTRRRLAKKKKKLNICLYSLQSFVPPFHSAPILRLAKKCSDRGNSFTVIHQHQQAIRTRFFLPLKAFTAWGRIHTEEIASCSRLPVSRLLKTNGVEDDDVFPAERGIL